jgi:cyclopropane fatty-acyl-phospholipid synthase-like methyltransferase
MSEAIMDLKKHVLQHSAAQLLTDWFPRLDIHGGIAIDLGCGSGAEAEYLAKNGLMVDAIDKSEAAVAYTTERCQGLTVDAIRGDFREFTLRPEYYAMAVAINSLPFLKKEEFPTFLLSLQASLKAGGAAVLAVYGHEHAWAARADMNFWLLEEFKLFWAGWEILALEEHKGLKPLLSGEEIFQHRIHLVARKPLS